MNKHPSELEAATSEIDVTISKCDLAFEENQIQVALQGYQCCLSTLMESCKSNANETNDQEENRRRYLHLFTQIGECFSMQGYIDDAVAAYISAFRMRMTQQEHCHASGILYSIGSVMEDFDFNENAVHYYKTSISILNLDPEDNYMEKMERYYALGSCLFVMGLDDEALDAFENALTFGRMSKTCSQRTISGIVYYIADILNDDGRVEDAIQVYLTSLEMGCQEGDEDVLVTIETIARCADLLEHSLAPEEVLRMTQRGISLCIRSNTGTEEFHRLGPHFSKLAFVCGLARLQMRTVTMAMESFASHFRVTRSFCLDPQAEAQLYYAFDMKRVNEIYKERMLLSIVDYIVNKFGSAAAA